MLTRLNYQVTAVDSAQAALDHMAKDPPRLVVLDMVLGPEMDGLILYRRMLALHPKQKAVITSGYAESARVKKALEAGAGGYIRKPYSLRQIALAVRLELEKE